MFINDTSGNGVSAEKILSDKREHARFKVQENVFALLEADGVRQPALVVNVGRGGVCVHYSREECACRWQQLTISSFHADSFLGRLPVSIVYDRPVANADNGQTNGIRRCGLKFSEPTYTQQALWDIFLEQNAAVINGKASPEF
jgi:hypothetical protein